MSEHEQGEEETSEEREETMRDLEVPEDERKDITGGRKAGDKPIEY